jgi:hypothetical protein
MIGDGSQPWHFYREDSEASSGNGFSGTKLNGELESYDKGGYIVDIPFNQSKEQFQEYFTNLVNANYFESTTRAFFLQFTIYDTISDYFIVFDMMVEFLVSGNIFPTYIKILPFKANIFELTGEKLL